MNRNFRTFLILMFVAFLIPTNVFASIKASFVIGDKTVKEGESVEIALQLKDSSKAEMNAFQTVIAFDENIFEGIDEKSLETYAGWSDAVYNKETHSLVLISKYGSVLDGMIVSFKLKPKTELYSTKTNVELKHTIIANDKNEAEIEDVSLKLTVSAPEGSGSKTSNKVYTGKELKVLSATDYNKSIIKILEIVIAIFLAIAYKFLRKKTRSRRKRKYLLASLCAVELIALSAIFLYDTKRGDLNNDAKIDMSDVEILSKNLVNASVSKYRLAKADMNKDGLLTVQDLAMLVLKSADSYEYEVLLMDATIENTEYEKGAILDFRFLADGLDNETIEFVMIDGKKYKVEKVEDSKNEYKVELSAATVSKKYKYNISEIILSNGERTKVNYTRNFTVLKDIPKVKEYVSNVNSEAASASIALTVEDNDSAMKTATYELLNSSGTKVEEGILVKGKNTFTFSLQNAVSYKFKVKIEYDRGGSDGIELFEDAYDLKLISDYKFQIGSLSIMQEDRVVTILKRDTPTKLIFTSSNISGYDPRNVYINGKQCSVTKLGSNRFSVEVPNDVISAGNTLSISKVTLSNGKVILTNEKISYTLLKSEPVLKDVFVSENKVSKKIDVSLNVDDKTHAIDKLTLKLFDENETLVDETVFTDGIYEANLKTSPTASKYKIQVFVDYSLLPDSTEYTVVNKFLYETTFEAILKADLNKFEVSNLYPEKNSTIELLIGVVTNYDKSLKKIIINESLYEVQKVGIDTYSLELSVGETSGITTFNATNLVFDEEVELDVDAIVEVDVLKDLPIVDNFGITEDEHVSAITVSFDVFDNDDAFRRGKVKLIEKTTGLVKDEKDVIIGKNEVTFTLKDKVLYDIDIVADIVLDSLDEEVSENRIENYSLNRAEYSINIDYDFDLISIEASINGEANDVFASGSKIDISFISTNATEYYPIRVQVNGVMYDVLNDDGVSKFTYNIESEPGELTLRFEKVILSNHAELNIDGIKRLEILKSAPSVGSVTLDVSDDRVKVEFALNDKHSLSTALYAIVLDGEEEVLNEKLTQNEFTFTIASNTKYRIKILADYKLTQSNGTTQEYLGVELFDREVDLSNPPVSIDEMKDASLNSKETHEAIDVTIEELEYLNLYEVKLVFKDESERVYEIERIRRLEDAVFFALRVDEWILQGNGKWANEVEIEYGHVVEGKLIKRDY